MSKLWPLVIICEKLIIKTSRKQLSLPLESEHLNYWIEWKTGKCMTFMMWFSKAEKETMNYVVKQYFPIIDSV